MAGTAAFGITRSIYSLQKAQMPNHAVPFCVPVSLVHLMNIDHAHSDTFLHAANKLVISERFGRNFSFLQTASVECFLTKINKQT